MNTREKEIIFLVYGMHTDHVTLKACFVHA